MSAPVPGSKPLSSAEGFICGGTAACVAVRPLPRRPGPVRHASSWFLGDGLEPCGSRENTHAASGRARQEGRPKGVQECVGCYREDMAE